MEIFHSEWLLKCSRNNEEVDPMSITRRLVSLVLAVMMLLSVCSFATAEKETITLQFWAHWASEQRMPTIQKICDMFNEKYADQGIQVEYLPVSYGEIETKLINSIGNNPPAVVITAIEDVANKAMKNIAENITPYLSEGAQDDYYATYWNMVTWNDGVYAIPFNTDNRVIYYNKAMFTEAGVSVEEITDWASFQAACVKLDEAMNGKGNYIASFCNIVSNVILIIIQIVIMVATIRCQISLCNINTINMYFIKPESTHLYCCSLYLAFHVKSTPKIRCRNLFFYG